MDTDVEVIKELEPLLKYDAFSGYESDTRILTGTMASCRYNEWIEMLLKDYDNRHFKMTDGKLDLTTNVEVSTRLTKKRYHLTFDGTLKAFGQNMVMLPFDYLCAKDLSTGEIKKTVNTYTIHHFTSSWLPKETQEYKALYQYYYQVLKAKGMPEGIAFYLCRIRAILEVEGMAGLIKKIF
jgi:hypothetical protein